MTEPERQAIQEILSSAPNPVVVECGAYRGEDGLLFEGMVGADEVLYHVMVEPMALNCYFIRARPASRHTRILIEGVVAERSGIRLFRASLDSRDGARGSGSILEPTGHLAHFPTVSFATPVCVPAYTLNGIFTMKGLTKIDLVWADIQGAEREMILGGKIALAHTRYLFIEAETVQMYKGQALKSELLSLLEGWQLVQDFDYNLLLRNENFP